MPEVHRDEEKKSSGANVQSSCKGSATSGTTVTFSDEEIRSCNDPNGKWYDHKGHSSGLVSRIILLALACQWKVTSLTRHLLLAQLLFAEL